MTWPTERQWERQIQRQRQIHLGAPSKSDPRDLWPLEHLIRVMRGHDLTNKNTMTKTSTKTKTMTETMTKTIPETCDIWDTYNNFDKWEAEFMTIFVAWHLRVTLDSIRNSCDVFLTNRGRGLLKMLNNAPNVTNSSEGFPMQPLFWQFASNS